MVSTEAQKRASSKWTKDNVKTITFGLRKGQDDDIIEFLDSKKNRQQYLKDLIRSDMSK